MTKVKTTRAIADGSESVLFISHDVEEGVMVMTGEESLDETNTVIVSIEEVVSHDPTLAGIETLPDNWQATRSNEADAWEIGAVE